MNSLKKVLEKFSKFMDLFGVYVPTLAFAVLFLCFMATMILRYCFKISLNWGSELAVLCYIWIMSFGSGKGLSLGDHVVFSLVYDRCSPKVQMVMKVVYNIVLFVLLLVALPACYKAMMRSNMITGVLKIPYKVAFAPFLYMLVDNAVRSLAYAWKSVKEYKEQKNNSASEEVSA
jgi:TRAP-type C4-dicarboxylate transport system permease small subunit